MITRVFVVDRIEGRIAVLIDDDERALDVPLKRLPKGIHEGHVLRVPQRGTDQFEWGEAIVDEQARAQGAEEAKRILHELKKRDPGGDVSL